MQVHARVLRLHQMATKMTHVVAKIQTVRDILSALLEKVAKVQAVDAALEALREIVVVLVEETVERAADFAVLLLGWTGTSEEIAESAGVNV